MDKKPFFTKTTNEANIKSHKDTLKAKPLIPSEGYIKVSKPLVAPQLTSEERVLLQRKANIAFNSGDVLLASKIALTIGYTDGIIRVGDHYYNKKDFVQALAFYKCAGDAGRTNEVAEKIAISLRAWLDDDPEY